MYFQLESGISRLPSVLSNLWFSTVTISYGETQHRALLFVTHAAVNKTKIKES